MKTETVILVAGNPNLYPLEYYNSETENYEGVIPGLLQDFAKEYGYHIEYVAAKEKDEREHLNKNLQVDLISGCTGEEEFLEGQEGILAFRAGKGEDALSSQILVADIAPRKLERELRQYFSGDVQELTNELLLCETENQNMGMGKGIFLGAAGAVLGMGVLLFFLVRHYRKKLSTLLRDQETDVVTGLGNRRYLERYYRQIVNEKNRILYYAVFFYTDIERLLCQRGNGDKEEFLKCEAELLREYKADADLLAKTADDGIVILKRAFSREELLRWLALIFNRIESLRKENRDFLENGIFAGVYPLKSSDWNLDAVLMTVRQTAKLACERKESILVCGEQLERELAEEQNLKTELKRAFEQEEFQIYLHFYVNADTTQIIGAEALSRWNHPIKGFLEPGKFIGLLEKEGVIQCLDYYGLRKVCFFLERVFQNGTKEFFVSCNFSRETFSEGDFAEKCLKIIEEFRFPRQMLVLELTESISEVNSGQIYRNMTRLREEGIHMMLDDFGEGFATFSDLQKYPVTGVKLAKSLVDHIKEEKGRAILQAVVTVGHSMKLLVLAEGVENDQQLQLLKKMGCDAIQGYLFYHPIPEWEAEKLIKKGKDIWERK